MTVIINELLGITLATQIKRTCYLLGYQGVGVKRNSARQHDTLRATEHWKSKSLPPAIMETRGSGSTDPVYSLVHYTVVKRSSRSGHFNTGILRTRG